MAESYKEAIGAALAPRYTLGIALRGEDGADGRGPATRIPVGNQQFPCTFFFHIFQREPSASYLDRFDDARRC